MDTRDGTIYNSLDEAKAAGVPDDYLVSGTRQALENLKPKIRFSGGSFKHVDAVREPPRWNENPAERMIREGVTGKP